MIDTSVIDRVLKYVTKEEDKKDLIELKKKIEGKNGYKDMYTLDLLVCVQGVGTVHKTINCAEWEFIDIDNTIYYTDLYGKSYIVYDVARYEVLSKGKVVM